MTSKCHTSKTNSFYLTSLTKTPTITKLWAASTQSHHHVELFITFTTLSEISSIIKSFPNKTKSPKFDMIHSILKKKLDNLSPKSVAFLTNSYQIVEFFIPERTFHASSKIDTLLGDSEIGHEFLTLQPRTNLNFYWLTRPD